MWISSCLMNFLCHIFMINNLLKKGEYRRVYSVIYMYMLQCNVNTYIALLLQHLLEIPITSETVTSFHKWD
jgi:hypothetical protein